MHLRIIPDHQKLFFKKDIFAYFQTTRIMSLKKIFFNIWSGLKRVLMHLRILSDHKKHQKLFFKKDIFERLEWLKTCLMHLRILPDHQNNRNLFQKRYFWTSGVVKRVLMHLRILPDHQKLFFKKGIFYRLEWLKTCFDAFANTSRPPETFFQKKIFLTVWSD
jgi:hypothetical protein